MIDFELEWLKPPNRECGFTIAEDVAEAASGCADLIVLVDSLHSPDNVELCGVWVGDDRVLGVHTGCRQEKKKCGKQHARSSRQASHHQCSARVSLPHHGSSDELK